MVIEPHTRAFAHWALLGSLLSLFCCTEGINVALHAQAPPSSEQIVGSAVTMAGVRQALLSENRRGDTLQRRKKNGVDNITQGRRWSVENVTIFYPFVYNGLHDRSWDLVIIEGWFAMINSFIHEVRVISHPRAVTVLFYCLDPIYPGLPHVAALDVEGFLTNSETTRQHLLQSAPTALVPLAVDIDLFPLYPDPPWPAATARIRSSDGGDIHDHDASVSKDSAYGCGRVVYVGAAGLLEYKGMLAWMLREAAPYGLDIYGSGWQNIPEFSAYWRGVLPQDDLASVYGTALAVIGVTMDAQRESGKINNRVFEALSVGASLISDHFPALEVTFGDAILYVQHPGDVAQHIETLLLSCHAAGWNGAEAKERQRRRAMIEDSHSWAQRVDDIMSFVGLLPGNGEAAVPSAGGEEDTDGGGTEVARCLRQRGCLTLAIVVDGDLEGGISFESTFVPAVELLGSTYLVAWWVAPVSIDGIAAQDHQGAGREGDEKGKETKGTFYDRRRHIQLPRDASCLSGYDIVWAAGRWGGPADRTVRGLLQRGSTTSVPRMTTTRLTEQLAGLVLWGPPCAPRSNDPNNDVGGSEQGCPEYTGDAGLRWYDVVYCQTRWDYEFLAHEAFEGDVSDNLQQAWGFGTARTLPPDAFRAGVQQQAATSHSHPLDILVVGTDAQIPEMLRFLNAPGLTRGALAIVVPPVSAGTAPTTQSEIGSVLAAAGVVTGEEIGDLPQRLSLYAVDPTEGSSFTPLATEVLFVRSGADAEALAELASGAALVAVVATGQLGAWATLVTTSDANDGRRWGLREREGFEAVQRPGDVGGDGRIRDLIEERPKGRDAVWYSRRLVGGVTRALCLGRGNSRISLVRPVREGSAAGVVGAVGTVVTVEVLVEDFHVGRDGEWCIAVQGRTALCVLQNRFVVDIHVSSSASEEEWGGVLSAAELRQGEHDEKGAESSSGRVDDGEVKPVRRGVVAVEIAAELRSNMYTNVLQRSEPFKLYIDPSVDAASAYGVGARCSDEEQSLVDCNQTSVGDGDSFAVAFVDAKDFFETGHIVALGVTRDKHVPRVWR